MNELPDDLRKASRDLAKRLFPNLLNGKAKENRPDPADLLNKREVALTDTTTGETEIVPPHVLTVAVGDEGKAVIDGKEVAYYPVTYTFTVHERKEAE